MARSLNRCCPNHGLVSSSEPSGQMLSSASAIIDWETRMNGRRAPKTWGTDTRSHDMGHDRVSTASRRNCSHSDEDACTIWRLASVIGGGAAGLNFDVS